MIKSIKFLFILSAFCLLNIYATSQTFNYSLIKDSSVYVPLSSKVVLLNNESFIGKQRTINLPFSFNFCGSATDSVIIETNGFLVFDRTKALSIVAFNNFNSNIDSLGVYSASINHTTTGSSGNRIEKIEFKDLSINSSSDSDNLSYQIWLYENGNAIEYHIGPNSYSNQADSQIPVLMGIINQRMDAETNGVMITGSPSFPSTQTLTGESEISYINNVPAEGNSYRLSPGL